MQQAISTLDMVTCISNEYEHQDQRLNETTQRADARQTSRRQSSLPKARATFRLGNRQ